MGSALDLGYSSPGRGRPGHSVELFSTQAYKWVLSNYVKLGGGGGGGLHYDGLASHPEESTNTPCQDKGGSGNT